MMRLWLIFTLLFLSILMFAWLGLGHAELRLNLGVGATTMLSSDRHDGQHVQLGFAHDYDQFDLGFRGGLEYRLTEHWAISANYVRLGTSKVWTMAASDEVYDSQAHACTGDDALAIINTHTCSNPYFYHAQDTMQGPEVVGSYRWAWGAVEPFATIGAAWMLHTATNGPERFHGVIPMLRAGGGVCYGWLCADTTYYRGVGESGYPVVADALLSLVFLSIPLGETEP